MQRRGQTPLNISRAWGAPWRPSPAVRACPLIEDNGPRYITNEFSEENPQKTPHSQLFPLDKNKNAIRNFLLCLYFANKNVSKGEHDDKKVC
jgi:hypothetical protein